MKTRGFTILEILVVISVIAVLATVAIPKFKGMQEQGKISKAKSELKTLQAAIESYYIHHSSYPAKATFMADLTGAPPQMISQALVDPFAANGTDYYKYSVNGRNYAVWSVGLDHTSATADIDASGNVLPGGDDILVTNGTIGAGGGTPPSLTADGQACTDNADCVSGACGGAIKVCRSTTGGKAPGVACSDNSECASSYCGFDQDGYQVCTDGSVGKNCYDGSNCRSGYCDPNGNVCTDGSNDSGCGFNSDCVSKKCANYICSDHLGAIGDGCNEAESCADGFCDNNLGACTDGSNDSACGFNSDCVSQKCANYICSDHLSAIYEVTCPY